jgi:hypothetical protein
VCLIFRVIRVGLRLGTVTLTLMLLAKQHEHFAIPWGVTCIIIIYYLSFLGSEKRGVYGVFLCLTTLNSKKQDVLPKLHDRHIDISLKPPKSLQ